MSGMGKGTNKGRSQAGIAASFASAFRTARTQFGRWFGLGIFWSWFWILIQRPTFDYRIWDMTVAWRIVTLASCALMFAAVIAARRLKPSLTEGRPFATAGGAVIVAFTLCCMLIEAFHLSWFALAVARTVLSGAVVAYLYVTWGRRIAPLGTQAMFACCSLALVVAFFCSILVFWVDPALRELTIDSLPLVSFIALTIAGFRERLARLEEGKAAGTAKAGAGTATATGKGAGGSEAAPGHEPERGRMSLKFLVTVFIMGTALGLLHALFNTVIFEASDNPYCPLRLISPLFPSISRADFYGYASIFGLLLTLAIIIVSVAVFHMNFRKLVYQVGFPLMALGFVIIGADPGLAKGGIAHVSGTNFVLGEQVYIAGYYYTEAIVWTICAYLIERRRADKTTLFAWTGCILIVGQLFGFFASLPLSNVVASQAVLCIIIVFALLFSGLFIVTNDSFWQEWGEAHATGESTPGFFKLACRAIAHEHHLTNREAELAVLLAHGRNASFIESELFISKNTVKTHARSIYRKLDVHSQQELIDLVERRVAELKAQDALDPDKV